jgi:hypothetical protein
LDKLSLLSLFALHELALGTLSALTAGFLGSNSSLIFVVLLQDLVAPQQDVLWVLPIFWVVLENEVHLLLIALDWVRSRHL